jgi:hypothetical protein
MLPGHVWALAAAAVVCGCVLGVQGCCQVMALVRYELDSVSRVAAVDGRHALQYLRRKTRGSIAQS